MKTVANAIDVLRSQLQGAQASSLYRTAPMYIENQPEFINAVVVGETEISVRPLLLRMKEIEHEFGRIATIPNGPRVLDLDVLIFGALLYRGFAMRDRPMIVPHPRIAERRFVLEPLAEVAPSWVIPGAGKVSDLAASPTLVDQDVRRLVDAAVSL